MTAEELSFPIYLTLKVCGFSFVLFLLLGTSLAFWFARSRHSIVKAVEFLVTLPLVFPPIALGYLLLLVLGTQSPLGGFFSDVFGIKLIFSQTGIVLAAFIAGLPLFIRPVQSALKSVNLKEIEDAARLCGAPPLKYFFFITLPIIRNSIAACLLLGLARASGEVGITMMLGGNISDRTNTLSLEIFNSVSRGDFETATFLCLLLAGFACFIYVALYLVQSKEVI